MKAGQLIKDGTVTWLVDDVRDGARVGDIILRPTLRDGYIKANGATVKASEYPRLVAYVVAEHMTVTSEEYKTNCGKYVYDEAADKLTLPNVTGRVLQGGESVKSVEAGLPNITGTFGNTEESYSSFSGAFSPSHTPGGAGSDGDGGTNVVFNASKSNPIYGASNTVQPPAITLIAQIKY
jgi:hypothetical protein